MATAAVARPGQALRTRRDNIAPIGDRKRERDRTGGMDNNGGQALPPPPPTKKRRLDEPHVITKDYILRKFAGRPPSLVLHLHTNYFRLGSQEGSWPYDSPMKFLLADIRRERVPDQMLEELLANNVPFYDGCLIVEVHNHRGASTGKSKRNDSATSGTRYSMHNYNSYVTPSPLVEYPKQAQQEAAEKAEAEKARASNDKGKQQQQQDGPNIATLVLFPTELTRHQEMLILAKTPASQMPRRKMGTDEPTTPQLSLPPTPMAATAGRATPEDNKMCLEPEDLYDFQAEVLLATQPPLLLDTVDGPEAAQKLLESLAHPLHQAAPPSPKTRKRTTAELAADDEKAAEAERRMLVMDERIKVGGSAGATENAGTAAAAFSRFKTLQVVREKLEQQAREKEEQDKQAQKQKDEAAATAARQQKAAQELAEANAAAMKQRQQQAMLRQRQQQQAQAQQQAYQQQQAAHAHPQQNLMAQQQQAMHAAAIAQASPVVRQQTPMMNSSPMMNGNGFTMQPTTTTQGAGSPPRPTSATVPNANTAMQRQVSQQQHASRNATPQMPQATPNMGGLPNRQMSQTPRMPQASPAPGTPASNGMGGLPMQLPAGMSQEQYQMLRAQQMANQQNAMAMQSGSPGQHNLTAEQISNIAQQRAQAHFNHQMTIARNANNPAMAQAIQQRQAAMIRQQNLVQQQRMQMAQNGQSQSPHASMQGTPQMNHAHPQQSDGTQMQMTPQQLQQRQLMQQQQIRQATATLTQLQQQYGSINAIPQQILQSLPPTAQMMVRNHHQKQNAARAQQMAARAQQAQQHGQPVAGSSGGDPEYMQTLRAHQEMLRQQTAAAAAAAQGNGGMAGNMGMNMGMNNQQQQQQQQQQFNNQQGGGGGGGGGNVDPLNHHLQAMHRALQQPPSNSQNGQM